MTHHQSAQGLASLGRHGDTMLVHMSPHEVAGLNYLAKKQGTKLTINPETGLPEAFSLGGFFSSFLPTIAGMAFAPETGGFSMAPLLAGAATGAGLAAASAIPGPVGWGAMAADATRDALSDKDSEKKPEQSTTNKETPEVLPPAPADRRIEVKQNSGAPPAVNPSPATTQPTPNVTGGGSTESSDAKREEQKGKAFSANTMCQLFLNIFAECGIVGASSHSGRRTMITGMAEKGVGVRVLAEIMIFSKL